MSSHCETVRVCRGCQAVVAWSWCVMRHVFLLGQSCDLEVGGKGEKIGPGVELCFAL